MLGVRAGRQKFAGSDRLTVASTQNGAENVGQSPARDHKSPLIEIRDLKVHFPVKEGFIIQRTVGVVKAVDGVNLELYPGETLGLVGESGSGKTTIGRAVLKLEDATEGQILVEGNDITQSRGSQLRHMRRRIGMVFQDPFGSLNPRMSAGNIVGEPLKIHGLIESKSEYRRRVAELLSVVGLNPVMAGRYPHEFSGGQRQRIGIARALALNPQYIVCDEPVSALDVSIQAQIINLLQELQSEGEITMLFISHDLNVVKHLSNRTAVMYLGKIVEIAPTGKLNKDPLHPYTKALLSAKPSLDPKRKVKRIVLCGDVPSPLNPPSGCHFHPRCPEAMDRCKTEAPKMIRVDEDHSVHCHLYDD